MNEVIHHQAQSPIHWDRRWLIIGTGLLVQAGIMAMVLFSALQPGVPDVTIAPVPGNAAICRIATVAPFSDSWINGIQPGMLVKGVRVEHPLPEWRDFGTLSNCQSDADFVIVQVLGQDTTYIRLDMGPRSISFTTIVMPTILAIIFTLTGITIYLRSRERPIARMAHGFFSCAAVFYFLLSIRTYLWIDVLVYLLSILTRGMATSFVCMLPHPHLLHYGRSRFYRSLPLIVGAALALVSAPLLWLVPSSRSWFTSINVAYTLICLIIMVWVMFWGLRSMLKQDKQIVRIVVVGIVVLLIPPAFSQTFLHYNTQVFNNVTPLLMISLATLPIVCGYAMIRHQLLGTTGIISRQVTRVLLWLLLASLFIAPSLIILRLLASSGAFGGGEMQDYLYAGLLALNLLLFPLAWNTVRNIGDVVFYHDFYQYNRSLRELSAALTRLQHLDEICTFILPRLATLLNATGVTLLVRTQRKDAAHSSSDFDSGHNWHMYHHAEKPFFPHDRLQGIANLALTHLKQPSRDPLHLDGVMLLGLYDGDYLSGFLCLGPKLNYEPYSRRDISFLATLAAQLSVLEVNSRYLEQAQANAQQLSALHHRVITAQENERRHLALELHDEVLQQAMLLVRQLSDASNMSDVATTMPLARSIVSNLRHTCLELRPPLLDELGLEEALHWLAQQYEQRKELQIEHSCIGTTGMRLAPEVELAFYRITQEALTNVIKHARASKVMIRLRYRSNGHVTLLLQDNGRGFRQGAPSNEHLGLIGMHERMHTVGGQLQIRTTPGQGVIIRATYYAQTTANQPLAEVFA